MTGIDKLLMDMAEEGYEQNRLAIVTTSSFHDTAVICSDWLLFLSVEHDKFLERLSFYDSPEIEYAHRLIFTWATGAWLKAANYKEKREEINAYKSNCVEDEDKYRAIIDAVKNNHGDPLLKKEIECKLKLAMVADMAASLRDVKVDDAGDPS